MTDHAASERGLLVGVDVGGTFTDVVALDQATGEIRVAKCPTTSADPAGGVLDALRATGWPLDRTDLIVHGTTITTNALLQRRMAKTGMITTAGFRDILELGRRTRPNAYGLKGGFRPLIPRNLRLEVPERMEASGAVRTPLDIPAVLRAAQALLAEGCESVVIHFLHACTNPAHELAAEAALRTVWPNANITVGHRLVPEVREYERGVTAAVNACVRPILDRYVGQLIEGLARDGYRRSVLLMNGNGGTVSARLAPDQAARTVMSGPASGVIAAARAARLSGLGPLMTYDMGGTSTDVALIENGQPLVSSEIEIDYALPIHLPMVDVRTIGAGGGSILSVDASGLLQIGPESAGAVPGPIAFGRGGTRPTLTDAHLLLGRLDPEDLLAVDRPASRADIAAAFTRDLCGPLGLDPMDVAEAALRVANMKMAGAIRLISIDRGRDPRGFSLFAFGGGGPLHASAVAGELGVPRIIVPPRPGITNAVGCLVADLRYDMVQTVNAPITVCAASDIDALLAAQLAAGHAALARQAVTPAGVVVERSADMKFTGQTHLIQVPLPEGPIDLAVLEARFAEAYFARFKVRLPEIRATIFTVTTSVIGLRPPVDLTALLPADARGADPAEAVLGRRKVRFAGQMHDTPIYDRARLPGTAVLTGPAILRQLDTTTLLEPGDTATTDAAGNLIIVKPKGPR
jgi:N-methylhydantoinase A